MRLLREDQVGDVTSLTSEGRTCQLAREPIPPKQQRAPAVHSTTYHKVVQDSYRSAVSEYFVILTNVVSTSATLYHVTRWTWESSPVMDSLPLCRSLLHTT